MLNGTRYGVHRVTVVEDGQAGGVRRHDDHDQARRGTGAWLVGCRWSWCRRQSEGTCWGRTDSEPSDANTSWPLPDQDVIDHAGGSCAPKHPMIVVCTAESAEQALTEGQSGLPPPRLRRHPAAVGVRPPPACPQPQCGPDRGAASAGALPQMPDHPCAAAGGTAATPGRRHRGDRHRTGPQSRRHGAPADRLALGRSPSTVRRWLRRAREHAHLTGLWQRGAQALIRLDADAFNQLAWTGNRLRDALTILAAAAWWTQRRLGINEPLWTLIGLHAHGRLLAAPG